MSAPRLSDLKVGDRLIADGILNCMPVGTELTIKSDNGELFVICPELGSHYLYKNDSDEVIGFTLAEERTTNTEGTTQ